MSVYSGKIMVEMKDDRSPLTLADKKSHEKIMEGLSSTGIPVLSEEGKSIPYDERKKWERFWMVDPLDGTKEFIKRNGEFTVNIALIENNTPVMGVIYLPDSDLLYFGMNESGSYLLNNASSFIKKTPADEEFSDRLIAASEKLPAKKTNAFTVVASRSHLSPETESLVAEYRKQYGNVEFVSKGSSIKICLVADGSADVYPRLAPTMEWDTAAGQAIATAAGCSVLKHPEGTPVTYNKENLLNPHFIVARN